MKYLSPISEGLDGVIGVNFVFQESCINQRLSFNNKHAGYKYINLRTEFDIISL